MCSTVWLATQAALCRAPVCATANCRLAPLERLRGLQALATLRRCLRRCIMERQNTTFKTLKKKDERRAVRTRTADLEVHKSGTPGRSLTKK